MGNIREALGDTEIAVEYVTAFPRTAAGTLRFVVSEMDERRLISVGSASEA